LILISASPNIATSSSITSGVGADSS